MIFNLFKKRSDKTDEQDGADEAGAAAGARRDNFPTFNPTAAAGEGGNAASGAGAMRKTEAGGGEAQEEVIADWLNQLPEHVRPYRLTDHYPRLAVRMAELWRKPLPLQDYLRSLVLDDRGGRQGFPEEIAGELLRLTSYVEEKIGPSYGVGFGRGREWGDGK